MTTSTAKEPMDQRNSGGYVLVVDDSAANRTLLVDLLSIEGYEVAEAEDGESALDSITRTLPDAVLLDVMMPGMDGFEVCRQIRRNEATTHLPVLMVTALTERSDRLTGIEAGANDFISKPVDSQEVLLRVRNAVVLKRLIDENIVYQRHLEQRVEEQTRELRRAHDRLQTQVLELDGRDRLVSFHLTGPTVDEAYEEILRVIPGILKVPRATLFASRGDAALGCVATFGMEGQDVVKVHAGQDPDPLSLQAATEGQPRADGMRAAVPLMLGQQVLGVLSICADDALTEDSLNTLWRLSSVAALVMQAGRITEDLHAGSSKMNDLIGLAEEFSQ